MWVLDLLPLLAAPNHNALRRHVAGHLEVVASLVLFGHVVEALLLLVQHRLKGEKTVT